MNIKKALKKSLDLNVPVLYNPLTGEFKEGVCDKPFVVYDKINYLSKAELKEYLKEELPCFEAGGFLYISSVTTEDTLYTTMFQFDSGQKALEFAIRYNWSYVYKIGGSPALALGVPRQRCGTEEQQKTYITKKAQELIEDFGW